MDSCAFTCRPPDKSALDSWDKPTARTARCHVRSQLMSRNCALRNWQLGTARQAVRNSRCALRSCCPTVQLPCSPCCSFTYNLPRKFSYAALRACSCDLRRSRAESEWPTQPGTVHPHPCHITTLTPANATRGPPIPECDALMGKQFGHVEGQGLGIGALEANQACKACKVRKVCKLCCLALARFLL